MEELVFKDETVDDLQNGYRIIQKSHSFRYGVDSVLLADFADIKQRHSVIDLGTGTGVIPILIYSRKKPTEITAVEIQKDMADMAERSIKLNGLEKSIKVLCMDLRDTPKILGKAGYDCVVTNPPYVKKECGINNPSETKAIARFEIMCSLEEVLMTARELLKPGGKLFMVHRTDRLADIIYEMRNNGIEPKRIRFVHPSIGKRPNLLLIEGARGGKKELKFMDPLYIHDSNGEYTEEIHRIYGRRS
ncbi:MAG: tRNA1(Val) (adenine(37)-N6)-methyltransferase [Clostridiaceae bacterium]|nr:tRNA1(Val) (adenine(37)-N6)-methyltransferase [Clostridiaceae bacterium]